MPTRTAEAEWKGNLKEGAGKVKLGSGSYEGPYTFVSRFENGTGTNPEELIGGAHAGCYSMALSHALSMAGFTPTRVHTTAKVHLNKVGEGFEINQIDLHTEAEIPNIDEATFKKEAEAAKNNCPVSKLFKGTKINLEAHLKTAQHA